MYSRARHIPTAPAQAQTKELKTVWGREVNLIHPHALSYVQTCRTYPNSSSAGADQRAEDCLSKGGNPHTLFYVQPCRTYPNSSAGADQRAEDCLSKGGNPHTLFYVQPCKTYPSSTSAGATKELKTAWVREVCIHIYVYSIYGVFPKLGVLGSPYLGEVHLFRGTTICIYIYIHVYIRSFQGEGF